jgi:hypothetical protein
MPSTSETTTPSAAAPLEAAQPSPQAANSPPAESRRADTQVNSRKERAQSSRERRRAAQRDRDIADQRPATDDADPTVIHSDRRDTRRTWSRRRDQYQEYTRDDDHRGFDNSPRHDRRLGRASRDRRFTGQFREDERVIGATSRDDERTVGRTPRDDRRMIRRVPRDDGLIGRGDRDDGKVKRFPPVRDDWFWTSSRFREEDSSIGPQLR